MHDGEDVILWDRSIVDSNNEISQIATDGMTFDIEIGYGIGVGHGSTILTPYGGLGLNDDGQNDMHLGSRYQFGSEIEFRLEGTRNINSTGESAHEISFDGKLKW